MVRHRICFNVFGHMFDWAMNGNGSLFTHVFISSVDFLEVIVLDQTDFTKICKVFDICFPELVC